MDILLIAAAAILALLVLIGAILWAGAIAGGILKIATGAPTAEQEKITTMQKRITEIEQLLQEDRSDER